MGQILETLTKPHTPEEDTQPTLPPREALQKLIYPEGKGVPQPPSAVDVAIHRILTQRSEKDQNISFEDVLTEMDPEDLKVVEKLKEEVEKRG